MVVLILFLLVIGLLLIGVPIAIALGLSSILFLTVYSDGSLGSIAQTLFSAFPGHYTLSGNSIFCSGICVHVNRWRCQSYYSLCHCGCRHLKGGLAIASVFACMMFAALSGSSPATVVAIGVL